MAPPDDTSAAAHPDRSAFISANTRVARAPLVPEIDLHLASEVLALWRLTEEELAANGVPPPFRAFAWAGGQALARFVLDHPASVAGNRVLDFATGSGLVAIAAMRAGAIEAVAIDVDPFATDAARMNAELNRVELTIATGDPIGTSCSLPEGPTEKAHQSRKLPLSGSKITKRGGAPGLMQPWLEAEPSDLTDDSITCGPGPSCDPARFL